MKTIYQNIYESEKAVLRGKFIAINAFIDKEEIPQICNLNSHFKKLEINEQKPKINRRKNIIKMRAEINKINNREIIGKIQ